MSLPPNDLSALVLPSPMRREPSELGYRLHPEAGVRIKGYAGDPEAVFDLFRQNQHGARFEVEEADQPWLTLDRPGEHYQTMAEQALEQLLGSISDPEIRKQAYVIEVGKGGAVALAGGNAGLYHAAQTLSKMISHDGAIRCCSIQDRPALAYRCALLDLSRGRVPLLAALKDLVDLLADLKYNQLTFNVEHVFACPARPEIGAGHDPITPAELKALAEYARGRHVDLIPFQQSLGHLREVLALPQYHHLAHDPELNWSITPASDETYALLGDLYDAQLQATDSPFFHVGCDEPFDMIKEFDPAKFAGRPFPEVVKDHLLKLHSMVSARGKTMMAWADAVVAHPEIMAALPRDLVLCHWSYGTGALEGPEHYRPALDLIADAGLPFYACASTWSLMKIHPDLSVMRKNHDAFAAAAKERGALGLMVTIWGDMGHMNLPGLEPYSLAHGARHAWENDPDPGVDFKRAYSWTAYGDDQGTAGELAESADLVNQILRGPAGMAGVGFLLLFSEPLSSLFLDDAVKDRVAAAKELRVAAKRAGEALERMESIKARGRSFHQDYQLAILQIECLATKLETIAYVTDAWPTLGGEGGAKAMMAASRKCSAAARQVSECLSLLESRWLAGSKPSGLPKARERHGRLARAWEARALQFEQIARGLESGSAPPEFKKILAVSPSGYEFDVLAEMGLAGLI